MLDVARNKQISRRRALALAGGASVATFLTQIGTTAASSAAGDMTGRVDIGGRSLYLEATGSGGPTVVFEAGYRSPATVWTDDLAQPDLPREMVQPAIAQRARTIVYERPGIAALLDNGLVPSRSDPVPMPRTADSVVADLHSLLAITDEQGPYVLVGHSLGGLLVRLYAATYPEDVVGLVLVDAWSEELEGLLTPEQWNSYVALNSAIPPELAAYPDLETIDFAAASAMMRQASKSTPLSQMPVAIVSKGKPFAISADDLAFEPEILEVAWDRAQNGLADLVPGARHIVANESSHYIQLEQPTLVTDAILAVVEAVHDPETWTI